MYKKLINTEEKKSYIKKTFQDTIPNQIKLRDQLSKYISFKKIFQEKYSDGINNFDLTEINKETKIIDKIILEYNFFRGAFQLHQTVVNIDSYTKALNILLEYLDDFFVYFKDFENNSKK